MIPEEYFLTALNGGTHDTEVRECISFGATDGSYIVATDHSIHDDIPTENVFAFIDAVKEYGEYPILL
jgi:uroporphyrinogen decarboxylase